MSSFASLGVPARLVQVLTQQGITDPFPIQVAALPAGLAGKDVLGRGRTGSGKTLTFALPMVARLTGTRAVAKRPRGLVLAPTRELATQIAATVEPLAAAAGLRVTTVFGGVSQHRQEVALAAGVDIVVACPGRLEDLIGQGVVSLADVEVTVLDEADHMADLGFLPGVRRILGRTPKGGQRLLFSATLDEGVNKIVREFLRSPVTASVDPEESPVTTMTHHVFTVADAVVKREVIEHLASGTGRRLLFTRTKHQAKRLAQQLTQVGIPAVDLHGNLSQNARERNLAAFSDGSVRVLVATDIAARGIHVDDVELVVHVDPPAEHKAYLHRSGRTARAGAGGDVVTLVLPEQLADMRALTKAARITAAPTPVRPGEQRLVALVGEVAPVVAPTARAAGGSGSGGSGSRPQRGGGAGGGQAASSSRAPGAGGSSRRGRGRGRGKGGASTAIYSTSTGGSAQGSSARQGSQRGSGSAPRQGSAAAAPAASGASRSSGAVALSMRGTRRGGR
jgi:superfamily II DNA/RNA helicase